MRQPVAFSGTLCSASERGAPSFHITGGNNHIDGYSYDAAGNLLSDGSHSYYYDAEHHLVQVDGSAGWCQTQTGTQATACYTYDAEGRRVRRNVPGSGITDDYLYDLAGHMITQVSSSGFWVRGEIYAAGQHIATYENDLPTATTFFTHTDHLGTERVETAVNGSSCETITNTAFGDGLNTSGSCDPSELRFTGKQRDWESNLDDFGARFYSSQLGRFMSADWSAVPAPVPYANLSNPQTLNLYVIVSDNPETFADLDGHCQTGDTVQSACPAPAGTDTATPAPPKVTDQKTGTGDSQSPTQKEVLAELKSLATQFGIPQAVVLATAQTESSLDVNAKNTNYKIDPNGNKIATSVDYGVMQVNSKNIGQTAAGPDGKSFVIGSDIETDWKANAKAGVAILAADYKLAVGEQPPGSTLEDHAQQAYSAYNAGSGGRDRYLQTGPNGLPSNSHDAKFLVHYQQVIKEED